MHFQTDLDNYNLPQIVQDKRIGEIIEPTIEEEKQAEPCFEEQSEDVISYVQDKRKSINLNA